MVKPVISRSKVAKLINLLEQSDDAHWNMQSYIRYEDGHHEVNAIRALSNRHKCGTTACIAGHIVLHADDDLEPGSFDTVNGVASKWLGIEDQTAAGRFLANALYAPSQELTITRDEAIKALSYLYNTGILHWSKFSKQSYGPHYDNDVNMGEPIEVEWRNACASRPY